MDRFINSALKAALLLATAGSLLSLVRMIFAQFLPISYYWWGAVAFIGATLVLAASIRLRESLASPAHPAPAPARDPV
jgi:hypothetical protein